MFPAFLTTIFFSLSAICGNRSARLIGGVNANFWRLVTAAFFLSTWAFAFGKGFAGKALPLYLLSGLIGIGLGDMAFYQALPRLGPRLTVMLVQCLTVPLAALIEWLWLGTGLSWMQAFCGVVILAGISISLAPGTGFQLSKKEWETGVIFGAIGALGNAAGAVISRRASAVSRAGGIHLDGGTQAFQRVFGGLVVAAVFYFWTRRKRQKSAQREASETPLDLNGRPASRVRRAVPWILTNGLFGQTAGVSCYQWALDTTKTAIVLPIVATTPLMAIPFTYFIDGERPSRRSILGGVVAVAGVIGLRLLN